MLSADLLLQNEATSSKKARKRKAEEDESEAGFHFIAFMPIEGQLWKLDGLERQPMCLGKRASQVQSLCSMTDIQEYRAS